jgi:predicted DNA-binding transcriptional regulator AlpA
MSDEVRYLKPRQVSERIGVAVKTLANWRTVKKGPPYFRVGGGAGVYPSDSLDEWISTWDGTPRR